MMPTGETSKPHAFVINLARRTDRRKILAEHLNSLHLDYVFVEAVDAQGKNYLDERLVTRAEAACWESHLLAHHYLLESRNTYGLILEDDALLSTSENWPKRLQELSRLMDENEIDILQVGFIEHLYRRFSKQGLGNRIETRKGRIRVPISGGQTVKIVKNDFCAGAHAYLISRSAASKLQGFNVPCARGADDFFGDLARKGKSGAKQINVARLQFSLVGQASRVDKRAEIDSDIV